MTFYSLVAESRSIYLHRQIPVWSVVVIVVVVVVVIVVVVVVVVIVVVVKIVTSMLIDY